MRALKIILIVVVILIAIFFIGGFVLPKSYSVTRTTLIHAPDSVVFGNIADLNNFLKWNPWIKMEPSAKVEITGPIAQPGHMYTWNGDKTGRGQMRITNLSRYSLVEMELKFIEPFENLAHTQFLLEPESTGTKVSWVMSGQNNSTAEKWMSLIMEGSLASDFETGLQLLKELSEK